MKNKLIGFTGPKGVGKTTAATLLKDHFMPDLEIIAFASPMKKCLQQLFRFSDDQLYTLEGKEAVDPRYEVSPREVMQKFGTEFVRNTVPDLWIILMENRIKELGEAAIIDDVRFDNEAQLIRALGGRVIHVFGRTEFSGEHESEQGITFEPEDLELNNNYDIYTLKLHIQALLHWA